MLIHVVIISCLIFRLHVSSFSYFLNYFYNFLLYLLSIFFTIITRPPGSAPPRRGAKYAMSMSLCLSVCMTVRSHASKTRRPNCMKFLYELTVAVAWFFSDNNVRYVLPVLWMTSCLLVSGQARATPIGRTHKRMHIQDRADYRAVNT